MRSGPPPVLRLAFIAQEPWRLIGRIGLVVAICVAGTLGAMYRNFQIELAAVENNLAKIHRASALKAERAAISPDIRSRTAEEVKAANGVIRRLSLPWEDLFTAIEGSIDDDVTLISIEPQSEAGQVTITAEARSAQSMTDYGQRLASSARFGDVRIQSHQVQAQDPQKPVRFTLLARWLVPGRATRGTPGGPV